MLVKDHRPSALKAAFLQRAQEAAPEHLVFGVADIDAQEFPAADGGDPVAITTAMLATCSPPPPVRRTCRLVASRDRYEKRCEMQRPAGNAAAVSSNPAQIRDISDFEEAARPDVPSWPSGQTGWRLQPVRGIRLLHAKALNEANWVGIRPPRGTSRRLEGEQAIEEGAIAS